MMLNRQYSYCTGEPQVAHNRRPIWSFITQHKLQKSSRGSSFACLLYSLWSATCLQFVITHLSGWRLTFNGVWHFVEVFSSWINPGVLCTGQMADSMYGVVWVSCLLMSVLWIKWLVVVEGLWHGQGLLWWYFECTEIVWLRSCCPFLCLSSTTINSCCSMIMHSPMLQGSVRNILEVLARLA